METTRSRVLLFAAAVLLVLALAFSLSRSPEPEYRGKKLSEWVSRLRLPERGTRVPRELRGFATGPETAVDAIRHIGTNALPYLRKWITYRPPPWSLKYDDLVARIFNTTTIGEDMLRGRQAVQACKVLGPETLPMLRESLANMPPLFLAGSVAEAIDQLEADANTNPAAPQNRPTQ